MSLEEDPIKEASQHTSRSFDLYLFNEEIPSVIERNHISGYRINI